MCFKKNQSNVQQTMSTKHTGAIASQVGALTEKVSIGVRMENGGSRQMQFVIDTGSDWTEINSNDLTGLGLTRQDLNNPTATATGEKLTPRGFFEAQLQYGVQHRCVSAHRDAAAQHQSKQLDIVKIDAQPQVNSILVPFDERDVCLASTVVQSPEKTEAEDVTKQRLTSEFRDVYETQPPMKGEQFKIVLHENATPCCITKARKILIEYETALRDELDELLKRALFVPCRSRRPG